MLTIEYRPATGEERATLEAWAQPSRDGCIDGFVHWFISLIGGGVLGMLAGTALIAGPFYIFHLPNFFVLALSACGMGLGLAGGARNLWRGHRDSQQRIYQARQEVEDGRVQIWHCSVRDALRVEIGEFECWFLAVDERKVLFLGGSYLDEDAIPESDDDLELPPPCQTFDLIKTPLSSQLMKIVCLDAPLTDWKTREDFVLEEYFPADGEVLDASLDTLSEDLKRLKQEKNQ